MLITKKSLRKRESKDHIVTINPFSAYIFHHSNASLYNPKNAHPKKEFYASYLHIKDTISSTVSISQQIPKEDIKDAVELEGYRSLNLDKNSEYKFAYQELLSSDAKSRFFAIFAYKVQMIENSFKDKRVKYIDFIAPAPLLLNSLYETNILKQNANDCFIYFEEDDAFLAIYEHGRYAYSKPLPYSLTQMQERFSAFLEQKIDEKLFLNLLATDDLTTLNPAHKQALVRVFEGLFAHIDEMLDFYKKSHHVDTIDNLFIFSNIKNIKSISKYGQNYLGIKSGKCSFFNNLPPMHFLTYLSTKGKNSHLNISIFNRPPAFLKRPSGKLTTSILAASFLAFIYPIYLLVYGYYLDFSSSKAQHTMIYENANHKKMALNELKEQNANLEKKLQNEKRKLQHHKKILDEILAKKVNPAKSLMLYESIKAINHRDIKIKSIVKEHNMLTLLLTTPDNTALTKLFEDMANSKKYSIFSKEIFINSKTKLYESNVSIGVL